MNQWMLWSRFAAINLFGAAALGLAWINGWVDEVIRADTSRISIVIFILFLIGLAATAWRIEKVTSELDHLERGQGGRLDAYRRAMAVSAGNATRSLELRLFGRITFIRHIANALVMLGLIGTVVGFVMALGGVNATGANDANSVSGMVNTLIQGMGVALYTTLVGSVLNLWLGANYQILVTGTANLTAALIDAASGDPDPLHVGPAARSRAPSNFPAAAIPPSAIPPAGASVGPAGGTAHV